MSLAVTFCLADPCWLAHHYHPARGNTCFLANACQAFEYSLWVILSTVRFAPQKQPQQVPDPQQRSVVRSSEPDAHPHPRHVLVDLAFGILQGAAPAQQTHGAATGKLPVGLYPEV